MRLRFYFDKSGMMENPYPPKKEQKIIVSYIQAQFIKIDKAIAIQEQMIEKLKEYKATLINSAVTGKSRCHKQEKQGPWHDREISL
ncbi:type I restriction enzyme, S subunit [Desulfobacula phenolica]|nr:type I restriction enzyme, S subunit [Desulfobacula phenolica]